MHEIEQTRVLSVSDIFEGHVNHCNRTRVIISKLCLVHFRQVADENDDVSPSQLVKRRISIYYCHITLIACASDHAFV